MKPFEAKNGRFLKMNFPKPPSFRGGGRGARRGRLPRSDAPPEKAGIPRKAATNASHSTPSPHARTPPRARAPPPTPPAPARRPRLCLAQPLPRGDAPSRPSSSRSYSSPRRTPSPARRRPSPRHRARRPPCAPPRSLTGSPPRPSPRAGAPPARPAPPPPRLVRRARTRAPGVFFPSRTGALRGTSSARRGSGPGTAVGTGARFPTARRSAPRDRSRTTFSRARWNRTRT